FCLTGHRKVVKKFKGNNFSRWDFPLNDSKFREAVLAAAASSLSMLYDLLCTQRSAVGVEEKSSQDTTQ
ncbi:hypothetical protein ATANTOWER_021746, partial [Ataeniobius toweri]|nr:hypothetical protein [Ataeniobius toweri]